MKRKFLILICLILFFVSVAAVSAAENTNQTVDGTSSVSTIDNIDQTNDTLGVFENVEELSAKDDGSFTALQDKINNAASGSVITLENDYQRVQSEINKIEISKPLTINGNGHTIDANADYYSQSRILFITSQVSLNDITFKNAYVSGHYSEPGKYNGGAIYSNANLVINNCEFSDSYIHEGFGSAIYCEANLELNNCVFTKHTGYAHSGYGTPTTVEAKSVKITNSRFSDNVLPVSATDATIVNSVFVNNDAAVGAENVDVKGSTFRNNSYSFNQYGGGAINAYNGKIDNCKFIDNSAFNGGALALGGKADVTNCIFEGNSARNGGALYINKNGEVSLTNLNFTKNTAPTGGAICMNGINNVLHGLNFISNSADYGGAIYCSECVNTIINLCNFIDNSANSYGSAIDDWKFAYNYIDNCYFADNSFWSGEIGFDTDLGIIYKDVDVVSKISNIEFGPDVSKLYTEGISLTNNTLKVHGYYNGNFLSGNVTLEIAGKTFKKALDEKGNAEFDLNGLSGGIHDATIYCYGQSGASNSQLTLPIPIESSTVLDVPDVTKDYGGPEQLQITLTESGSPVSNAKVNININKNDYTRTTGSNGKASMPINLNADTYIATVSYQDISTEAIVTVNKLASKTSLAYAKNSHNSVTLTASVNPSSVSGKVTFNVNGKDYPATVSGAKATYTLNNLAVGSYDAKATYQGDVNHKSSSSSNVKFTIEEYSIIVSAPDVTKYYGGDERFVVTVTDNAGKPVANEPVKVTINGQKYDRKTGADGRTTFAINLRSGTHEATTEHAGEVIKSKITVKTTVISKDVTKIFRNGTNYEASFLDKNGNKAPAGGKVSININGVFYQRTIKSDGSISFALNLEQGTYVLTMTNPYTGEEISNTVKILPNIVDNKDLTKYYRNGSQFTFKLLDDKGNPVAGQKASININGVFYTRTTNDKGIATFQINLEPGTYILTMEYKGCRVSNTVTVLSVIKSSDIKMKYQDGTRFKVTILDGVGKPYAKQSVTFNINGVFYYRTTKDDGSTSLAINLMAGEYIITTTYNSLNVSNKVTIAG